MVDAPRLSYRALMIDVARNFLDKRFIVGLLDVMAMYKMNALHLHLSDDQGWRLQVPTLPELTDVCCSCTNPVPVKLSNYQLIHVTKWGRLRDDAAHLFVCLFVCSSMPCSCSLFRVAAATGVSHMCCPREKLTPPREIYGCGDSLLVVSINVSHLFIIPILALYIVVVFHHRSDRCIPYPTIPNLFPLLITMQSC